MQRSAVLVKPDGIQRALIGEIIHRFERKGLKLAGLKMTKLTDEQLDEWYSHHKDKPFFPKLKGFMMQTPVIAMVWEGLDAIDTIRKLVGVTKGREAEGGSIRGDFAMSMSNNLIHASDSPESAAKEIGIMFEEDEMFEYASAVDLLIYSEDEV
jgi:nucleoside-diphosphate kinase